MKLNLLVLRCSDIEISKTFYEKFGFSFSVEKHGKGPIHYSSETAGFVFEIYPLGTQDAIDNIRLGFSLVDKDYVINNLPIIDKYEFEGRSIYIFQDPDGRKIEINE